jgi:hypothetical protein
MDGMMEAGSIGNILVVASTLRYLWYFLVPVGGTGFTSGLRQYSFCEYGMLTIRSV